MRLQVADRVERRSRHCRIKRVREEIRARAIAQIVGRFPSRRDKRASRSSQSLSECAGYEIDTSRDASSLWRTTAVFAHHSNRVRVVDHDERAVFFCHIANFFERRDVTVHTEYPVSCYDHKPLIFRRLQFFFKVDHVHVLEHMALCLREPNRVDDRSMVELVADDGVFRTKERLKKSEVRHKARGIENGIFRADQFGHRLLQTLMYRLCAANKAHGCEAVAPFFYRLLRGVLHEFSPRKPEIVVCAKIQELLSFNRDFPPLWRFEYALHLVSVIFLCGG